MTARQPREVDAPKPKRLSYIGVCYRLFIALHKWQAARQCETEGAS